MVAQTSYKTPSMAITKIVSCLFRFNIYFLLLFLEEDEDEYIYFINI